MYPLKLSYLRIEAYQLQKGSVQYPLNSAESILVTLVSLVYLSTAEKNAMQLLGQEVQCAVSNINSFSFFLDH